jgi:hypothetical protein
MDNININTPTAVNSVPNNIGNGENIQTAEQVEINSIDNVPQMVDGGQVINENDNRLILNWGLIFTFFKE